METGRRSKGWRQLGHVLVIAALVGLLPVGPAQTGSVAAQSAPLPPLTPVRVTISDGGVLDPLTVTVAPDQVIEFDNVSTVEQQVAAVPVDGAAALFDSGPIPPGGRFVLTLRRQGTFDYETGGTDPQTGRINVGFDGLSGAATANARANVPTTAPPVDDDEMEFGLHPIYGLPTSRTDLLVLPAPNATVQEVNEALRAAGAVVTGGFPLFDNFVVSVLDRDDFEPLLAAQASLRASPAIDAVALNWATTAKRRLPRPPDLPDDRAGWATDFTNVQQWNLRRIRAAAAWNALERARENISGANVQVQTVVIDAGFAAHPDLPIQVVAQRRPDNHGTHVAGVIGARYDSDSGVTAGRSAGVVGVNPVADMYGLGFGSFTVTSTNVLLDGLVGQQLVSMVNSALGFESVLADKRSGGRYPGLAVVNASFGGSGLVAESTQLWSNALRGRRCGLGANDDRTPAATQPCTPANQDEYYADLENLARASIAPILQTAKSLDVVIAAAAGNEASILCEGAAPTYVVGCDEELASVTASLAPLEARATNEFVRARKYVSDAPLLVVGAVDVNGAPASFSQDGPGVDIQAPGVTILSTVLDDDNLYFPALQVDGAWYDYYDGTSMATPHISGVIGYLLAVNGGGSPRAAAQTIVATATAAPGGGTPLLDMYAATMAFAGASAFADQSDSSADGNERVPLDLFNWPQAPVDRNGTGSFAPRLGPRRASPDGRVDMRDLRAFRDAWLQTCFDGSSPDLTGGRCPMTNDIRLDGAVDSPLRDGNLDRCVNSVPPGSVPGTAPTCGWPTSTGTLDPIGETRFNRFDLNGDSRLSLNQPAPVRLPGAPSAAMTDLRVLTSAIDGSGDLGGYTLTQLQGSTATDLMVSGDIHVRFDRMGVDGSGADPSTGVNVYAEVAGQPRLLRTVFPYLTPEAILTVPVARTGSDVKVWAVQAGKPSLTITVQDLQPGQDVMVVPLRATLTTTAGPTALVPGRTADVTVNTLGTVRLPAGQSIESNDITFTTSGPGSAGAALADGTVALDRSGRATNKLTAGPAPDLAGAMTVLSTYTAPSGETATSSSSVEVVPTIRVDYVLRVASRSHLETGSTVWSEPKIGPDCADLGELCITSFSAELWEAGLDGFDLTRRGSITLTSQGVRVREEIEGGDASVDINYSWKRPDGTSGSALESYEFGPIADQRKRYTDRALPEASFDVQPSVVELLGFESLHRLGYVSYASNLGRTPSNAPDPVVLGVTQALFLDPVNTDATRIGPPGTPVRFQQTAAGWQPFQSCYSRQVDLDAEQGYRVGRFNPWVVGSTRLERDVVYDPGDVPMPVVDGEIVFRHEFAATISTSGSPPDPPVLPLCEGGDPPVASFEISDARGALVTAGGRVREGEPLRLRSTSTDPNGDITTYAWNFGDGRSSAVHSPLIGGYADSGTRTVKLTATDATGLTNTKSVALTVENLPPTVEAPLRVTVQRGQAASVRVEIDDPGRDDRRNLTVSVGSQTFNRAAGTHTLSVPGLTTQTSLTVTVTDKDGSKASRVVEVVYQDTPPAPAPSPCVPGAPGCFLPPLLVAGPCPTVQPFDFAESILIDAVVAKRSVVGLPTLSTSPELMAAAFVLLPSAPGNPNTVAERAKAAAEAAGWAAGSTIQGFSFTVLGSAAGILPPFTAEWLAILRNPDWQTMAVARRNVVGGVEYAVIFSDRADCDVTTVPVGSPPTLSPPTLPATTVTEGSTVLPVFTVNDPDGDPINVDIAWGDGATGLDRHRYIQNGVYTITVVAIDELQNRATATLTVTVTDVAPGLRIVAPTPVAGQPWFVQISALDPGELDRPIEMTVTVNGRVEHTGTTPKDQPVTLYQIAPPAGDAVTVIATGRDINGVPAALASPPPFISVAAASAPTPAANVSVTSAACATPVAVRAQEDGYLTLANGYRAAEGSPVLTTDPALQAAARAYATDLATFGYFSHTGRDGSDARARARAQGYPIAGVVGENLIRLPASGVIALRGWQMSPPHNANLLNPAYTATGVAVVNSPLGPVWVQLFGTVNGCTTTSTPTAPTPEHLTVPLSAIGQEAVLGSAGAQLPGQTAPAPTDPVVAFVIDDVTPSAGQTIRVTNVSRRGGVPIAADLVLPTGGTRRIEAGATGSFVYLSAQSVPLTLRASWVEPALSATSTVVVTGDAATAPTVLVTTPPRAARGSIVPVEVTLNDAGGSPLAGRTVRAELADGTQRTDAVTSDAGYAEIPLRLAVSGLGPVSINIWALDDAGQPIGAPVVRTVDATGNAPPDAVTAGPWVSNVGDSLVLDARGSTDPDGTIGTALWDLDGDNVFGEVAGLLTTELAYGTLERLVCAGSCVVDRAYRVAVRVIDNEGASADATTSITFQRDFGVFVGPQMQAIAPGGSNVFNVSLATTSGFDEPVTLSALDLPTGVTASFAPTVIRPGQQSSMTVTLPAGLAGVETIALAVQGRSQSGKVRVARPVVDVVFGLVPVCFGEVSGRAVDKLTGDPLAGVLVTGGGPSVISGADGSFRFDRVPLGSDNRPSFISIYGTREGRWQTSESLTVACGIPATVELRLSAIQTVDVRFAIRTGEPDPSRPGSWRPTAITPPGASLLPSGGVAVGAPADLTLRYQLGPDNVPTSVYGYGQAPGHQSRFSDPIRINSSMVGKPPQLQFISLPPRCTGRVEGGRVVDPDGNPFAGAAVSTGFSGAPTVLSGPDGSFTYGADVELSGSLASISLRATPPADSGFRPGTGTAYIYQCDETIAYIEIQLQRSPIPPPPPPEFDGLVVGTVTDVETGAPVAGALVGSSYWSSVTTDADGKYRITAPIRGPLGTQQQSGFTASKAEFWDSPYQLATVRSGDTITVDMAVLRKRTGDIEVVVRDLATGLPIDGAEVFDPVSGWRAVGPDGRAFLPDRPLNDRNQPRSEYVYARKPGYWDRSVLVEVRAGETTFVDLGLLSECQPAEVRGLVLDAATRQPLEGADLYGFGISTRTGADGRFTMTGIRMQSQNTPWQSNVSASKQGYLTQTQTISVFCGATIRVAYGPAPASPGAVAGVVTRADTGAPVANVFVGSDWGASVRTDANGNYRLEGAPLGDDGEAASWQVTAQSTTESRLAPATANVIVPLANTVTANLVMAVLDPPNRFPIAVVTGPNTVDGGAEFVLDASTSSDPDSDPIVFDWDLDADGLFDDAKGERVTTSLDAGVTRRFAVRVADDNLLTGVARLTTTATAPPDTTSTTSTTTTTTTTTEPTTTTTEPTTTTTEPTTTTTEPTTTTTEPTTTTTEPTTTTTTEPTTTTTEPTTTTAVPTTMEPRGANLAPVIELDASLLTVEVGSAMSRRGRVSDDGPGPLVATVDLDDGLGARALSLGQARALLSEVDGASALIAHDFTVAASASTAGDRSIVVEVCDAVGACSVAGFDVLIVERVVSPASSVPGVDAPVTTAPAPTFPLPTTLPPLAGELPATGSDSRSPVIPALVAMILGFGLVLLARRQHRGM